MLVLLAVGGQRASVAANARHRGPILEGADADTVEGRGRALAQVLGKGPAVLMRGHGAAVVGPSLPFAVGRSIYLELNARIQAQAMTLGGGNVTYLDPQEAKAVMDSGENRGYERAWELWKKKAMGK